VNLSSLRLQSHRHVSSSRPFHRIDDWIATWSLNSRRDRRGSPHLGRKLEAQGYGGAWKGSRSERRRSRKLQSSLFRVGPTSEDGSFYAPSPPRFHSFWFFYGRNCVHKSADTVMPVLTSRRLYRAVGDEKEFTRENGRYTLRLRLNVFHKTILYM